MITLVSQPHETGWVQRLVATDEQLAAYLAHPLDRLPPGRLRAYQRHVLTRQPTRAARARTGSRRRPVPRWAR